MTLTVQQQAKQAADNRWEWSVWIDGPDAELDQISSVEYVLHPTFPNPVRREKRRENKFRLDSSGWGEFEIHAQVTTKDGRRQHLRHWLRLTAPDNGPTPSSVESRPTVFLSAGIADAEWEQAIHDAFSQRGVDVLTASDIPGSLPTEVAISSTLDKADTVVGIFSEKTGSWAEREVEKAMEKDVSVVPIVVSSSAKIPPLLRGTRAVRVSGLEDIDAAVGQIVNNLS
jgi:transcription initiation factor IIF auxiliary subunit